MTSILVQRAYLAPAYYYPGKHYGKRYKPTKHTMTSSLRRIVGAKSLMVAIIEQAITDYFTLVRRGVIVQGKLTGEWIERSDRRNDDRYKSHHRGTIKGLTMTDAEYLLQFLQSLDQFACAAELSRDWRDAYARIQAMEQDKRYRRAIDAIANDDPDGDGEDGGPDDVD